MGYLERIENFLTFKKIILIFFIVGFLVYGNSISNGFVWDDEEQITKNPIIQDLGNLGQIFSGATFNTGGAGLTGYFFRPLITFTFMINYLFWGENAFGYHLFQILFHIFNACILFKILLILTSNLKSKLKEYICLLPPLIYLVHPAINEGVVYISAVSEVMFTFFSLVAFLLFLKAKNSQPTIRIMIYVSTLLFCATLYKESAVVGPLILISYSFILSKKYLLRWLISFTTPLLTYFSLRLLVIKTPIQHPQFSNISESSFIERLYTIPAELFHYLSLIFYPSKLAISQHFVIKNPSIDNFLLPLGLLILIFLSLTILIFKTRNKLILLGLVWLIISFAPVLNIVPLDMTVAERWFYFPFIGFLLVLTSLLTQIPDLKIKKVIIALLLIALIPLSVRTIIRNQDWKDGLTLYAHDEIINENSFDLENNLGVELFRADRIDEAKTHFEKSLLLQPKWHFTLNNLGAVYQKQGNLEKAKEQYLKVLENSDYYLAYENLSAIYLMQKKYQEGRDFIENALKKLPNNSLLWLNLAIAEYKLEHKDKALLAARNAYALNPSDKNAYIYSQLSQNKELNLEE